MEEKFYFIKDKQGVPLMSVGLFRIDDHFIRTCTVRKPCDQNNKVLAKDILRQRAIQNSKPFSRSHYRNEFRRECFVRLIFDSAINDFKKLLFGDDSNIKDSQFAKVCLDPILTPFEQKIFGLN